MNNRFVFRYSAFLGLGLLTFVIETVMWPMWIRMELFGLVYPHWLAVWILSAALYRKKNWAITGALFIGLLKDSLYYGHMIGMHALAYVLATMVIARIRWSKPFSWFTVVTVQTIGGLIIEMVVWTCYTLFQIVPYPWERVLMEGVLPSVACSIVFSLVIHKTARWLFGDTTVKETQATADRLTEREAFLARQRGSEQRGENA